MTRIILTQKQISMAFDMLKANGTTQTEHSENGKPVTMYIYKDGWNDTIVAHEIGTTMMHIARLRYKNFGLVKKQKPIPKPKLFFRPETPLEKRVSKIEKWLTDNWKGWEE